MINQRKTTGWPADLLMISVLVLLIVLFLLPLLLGRLGIFFDDYYGLFPRHCVAARSLQGGELPLWDPTAFAGARLNYVPQSRMWYWPLYPFFLLAPLGDVDVTYGWLIKAPLLLHWAICLLATYGLAREIIGLGWPGALVMALVYGFGAGMSGNISDTQTMYAVGWIPVVLWGITACGLKGRRVMAVPAALAVAFIGACGSDPRAVFSLLTVTLTILALAFLHLSSGWRRKAAALLRAGSLVFLIGFLLSGPYWTGMVEAVSLYRGSEMLDFSRVASPSSSTPFAYLLTLLVPDLYGTLTNAQQIDIGLPAISTYWHIEGNITGGYWLFLLCLLGGVGMAVRGRSGDSPSPRRWWAIGLFLFLLSWLLMTGCNSPFYRVLFRVIPVVGLPYPVRWRVMEHLGVALMAGTATHFLLAARRPLSRPWLSLAAAAVWIAVASQWSRITVHGESVFSYLWSHYRPWLLSGPVSYLLLATAGTGLLFILRRRPAARKLLIGAAGLETVTLGFLMTYFLVYRFPEMGNRRYNYPSETLYFRQSNHNFLTNLPAPRTGRERTVFYNSVVDQMATLHGGDYMFGLYSKPLEERFRLALEEVAEGYPYEIIPVRPGARFFPHMSVRHLVLDSDDALPPARADRHPLDGSPDLSAYRLREVMPRVFTHDRLVSCSEEEARRELVDGDLRKGVFVDDSDRLSVIGNPPAKEGEATDYRTLITDYRSLPTESGEEVNKRFAELQRQNEILSVRRPGPNRMEIEIEVKTPAMLVTTDVYHPGWRVTVDGGPADAQRVNYIQRGVWLPPGRHLVVWRFSPDVVRWGLAGTGLGVLACIIILVGPLGRRSRKIKRDGAD